MVDMDAEEIELRNATDNIVDEVLAELFKARLKHPAFHSGHEGWAVIREELDELWVHVRADTHRTDAAKREAIQVAAMGIRFALDLCDSE